MEARGHFITLYTGAFLPHMHANCMHGSYITPDVVYNVNSLDFDCGKKDVSPLYVTEAAGARWKE